MISVIVPVYNVSKYLSECVNSIINQSYKDLQIILVNDGSTDNSGLLCDEFATIDKRIKVIHKINGGLSSARNAGLNIATGEFVGFVDSDDYISSDMYQRLYDAMIKYPEAGVTSVSVSIFNDGSENIQPMNSSWVKNSDVFTSSDNYLISTISNITNVMVWNKLYRTEVVGNIRFIEGRNNEDARFQFDLSKKLELMNKGLIETPGCGYFYRQRTGSIMNDKKKPVEVDKILNLLDMLKETPKECSSKYNVIYKKFVGVYMEFMSDMLKKKDLRIKYWKQFYPYLKNISSKFIRNNFGKRYQILYFYLKYLCVH